MPSLNDNDPVADDEYLLRRIPISQGWYNPTVVPPLSPRAFNPRPEDTTGLSVYRERFKTAAEAAQGMSPKGYYVVVLKAGDLRAAGLDVVPSPIPGDPGHAEIASLTYGNRKTDRALEAMVRLATTLCLRVEGPFVSPPPNATAP